MKINKFVFASLLASLITFTSYAQEEEKAIDSSKPTNFYSMLDNTLELSNQPSQNVFGYRGKVTLTPSEAHLILGEIPLMYNDRTEKFGVGDIRARYFFLPYKNYDKLVGAFGPSIDIFAPTGSYENGLGSGRWLVSPGITVGLMAADWIQFFPILSYQYASEHANKDLSEAKRKATHGITFQVLTPLVFSDKFFAQLTPIYRMNQIEDVRADRFVQEVFLSYALQEKLQLTGFYSGNFEDEIHTMSVGLTVFL